MIGLVDANNFYVSCERVFQPKLEGRPVEVMSNNDGCVIARSAELKALDIPMGTPAFKLEGLRRRGEIHLLSVFCGSSLSIAGKRATRARNDCGAF